MNSIVFCRFYVVFIGADPIVVVIGVDPIPFMVIICCFLHILLEFVLFMVVCVSVGSCFRRDFSWGLSCFWFLVLYFHITVVVLDYSCFLLLLLKILNMFLYMFGFIIYEENCC